MDVSAQTTCRRNAWVASAIGGALVAALLVFFVRLALAPSIGLGLVVFVLGGVFLTWAFCGARSEPVSHTGSTSSHVTSTVTEAAAPISAPTPAASTDLLPTPPLPTAPPPRARPAPAARQKPAAPRKPRTTRAVPPPEERPRASALDFAVNRNREPRPALRETEVLAAPRGGRPDDLKRIRGIGPVLERLLNDVGVWHFDQIAGWKAKDIAFVDSKIEGFSGRITRDEWVKQARQLIAAAEADKKE